MKSSFMKFGIKPWFWINIVVPTVLRRDGNKCTNCGSKRNLEVHHTSYEEHTIHNLKTLCLNCHKEEHPDTYNLK